MVAGGVIMSVSNEREVRGMKEAERILEITKYIAENIGEYDCSDAMGSYNEKMFKLYRLGKCTKEQLDYFIKLKRLILDLYFCLYK